MGQGRFSDHRINVWLGELSTVWFSLHYDNPDIAGAYASEVFGGSYARARSSMSIATNRVAYNISPLLFTGLPAVSITHFGGWDAQYNGNMEFSGELPSPIRIQLGKNYSILANTIALSMG